MLHLKIALSVATFWLALHVDANAAKEVDVNKSIEFRLFAVDAPYIKIDPENLGNFTYKNDSNYIFLVHGFGDGAFTGDWYWRTIKKFLMKKNYVVIAAGYEKLYSDDYERAVKLIPQVGKRIGDLLLAISLKPVGLERFEMVGHGLGAHVAGVAADFVNSNANTVFDQQVKRVYAIDPDNIAVNYVKKSDAKSVVVMHTSSEGIQEAIGHVDFYPNGGLSHRVCQQYLPFNDHRMGLYYFICSIIQDCRMWATKCDSIEQFREYKCTGNPQAKLGYGIEEVVEPGKYYLFTFCWEMQGKILNY